MTITTRHGPLPDSCAPIGDSDRSLEDFEARLTRTLGPVIGGGQLSRALGFPSQGAFRQALARKRLPVPVFEIEGRRGRFALAGDIAQWLWTRRSAAQPARDPVRR